MLQISFQAIRALVVFTLITGVAYPLLVTGIAQAVFPDRANGSLVRDGDTVRGSRLVGQPFSAPQYFWSRPSATSPMPYNGAASSGSNQGPLNPALKEAVAGRVIALRTAGGDPLQAAPVDLVTASASGLDPHISPAAAQYQIRRVAAARHMAEERLQALVREHAEGRQWGMLGEPRVNVLMLNLALDRLREEPRN